MRSKIALFLMMFISLMMALIVPLHILAQPQVTGILLVQSDPGVAGGIQVYVDEEFRGSTSSAGRLRVSGLTPGTHVLRFSTPGAQDTESRVNIVAGASTTFTLKNPAAVAGPNSAQGDLLVFVHGIGPFRLGMSPEQVNAQLPQHFRSVSWEFLPVAREYGPENVRNLPVRLSDFSCGSPTTAFCQQLTAFSPCWNAQSYIVFFFTQSGGLIRIGLNLSLCSSSESTLRNFADVFGIQKSPADPLVFQSRVEGTVIEGHTGSTSWLYIRTDGSPEPNSVPPTQTTSAGSSASSPTNQKPGKPQDSLNLLYRASNDLISTVDEYGDFNTQAGQINVHYKIDPTGSSECSLHVSVAINAVSDNKLSFDDSLFFETTPLSQVDADSIDFKFVSGAGFKGWAYSFGTIDQAEVVRHVEYQGPGEQSIISHLTGGRYFAETQDSARRISEKLRNVVMLCQAIKNNQ
jgi:PEGA domain-containing protein